MSTVVTDSLARAETLVPRWLPDGKRVRGEWVARNPTRSDEKAGSFKINLGTGRWADFATGDKGGNLVSLLAYLRGCEWKEAAQAIDEELCVMPRHVPKPAKKTLRWEPLRVGVGEPVFQHYEHGKPSRVWRYKNGDGSTQGFVCRFDKPDGSKEVVPMTYCERSDGKRDWRWKAMKIPRILFNMDLLEVHDDKEVVVVEGEKAAEAAARLLVGYVVTTWAGGAGAVRLTDWEPLRGRKVWIFPDNDEPGEAAAAEVAKQTGGKVVSLPPMLPKGWDLADAEVDGTSLRQILSLIR